MPPKLHTLPPEIDHKKTQHGRIEAIISKKQSDLIMRVGLPNRFLNLLGHRRDVNCSVEILAYVAFPYSSHEKKLDPRFGHFRALLRSGLLYGGLRDVDLLEIKTAIQHAGHLTEHTRITIMDLLDDKSKQ